MLEISSKPRNILAHSALILSHPRTPVSELVDARQFIRGNVAYFKVGENYTAEHRLKVYDTVLLYGSSNCLLDFNKRLHKDYWINFLQELKQDEERRLILWGEILLIAGSHVCIVPSTAIYVNQTGHSRSIDIETAGLGLLPHRTGYDYRPEDKNTPRGIALLRLSMQQPMTMLSTDGWYETGPDRRELKEGSIYVLADGKYQRTNSIPEYTEKQQQPTSPVKPIRAIYEEEAVQPSGASKNEK